MVVRVQPTSVITEIGGAKVRLWSGRTESGIGVTLAVVSVIVNEDADGKAFERELTIQLPPLEKCEEVEGLVMLALEEVGNG
jgi:hypothetical protein